MALKIALVITAISIALLAIYGADAAVSQGADQGFLPLDHKIRGMGLGGPAMILPIIAFFISRKHSSKPLGVMLLVTGAMIIVGGAAFLSMPPSEQPRNAMAEAGPLFVVGAFQIALGALKIRK
ncbi:hypothetical protein [Candidatus Nitrosotenuis cloacae]|uniref:Uncharacterized protein n=1 Tax=Candidatus Nitrosotenuis cloacae TaxID=1603555 RepID=A0A3G1AZM2_9ARCH|nr:hypothetical protein [Candidatus Nitrosotenuis cloacae]AJZ75340.1 hypothetical protein SU86_001915 [Candidatus Nitrosotenuis cloacae]